MIVFVNATRSFIFFLSVTAFICFVLDHLLCPAWAMAVVASCRRHGRQLAERIGAALLRTRLRAASGRSMRFGIVVEGRIGQAKPKSNYSVASGCSAVDFENRFVAARNQLYGARLHFKLPGSC